MHFEGLFRLHIEGLIAIGFFSLVAAETGLSWARNLRSYELRDTIANFALAFSDLLMAAGMKGIFLLLFAFLHQFAPMYWGGSWYAWVALILVNDFLYYIFHRLGHRCRFMWAFHVTHHSSQRYNFTVAVRLNLFILPLHFLFMLPLAILGFSPALILAVNSLTTLYQLWVHTELIGKLPFLDRIFNTPSNHRVHHGKNPHYLDRNYGAIFIFWDRFFGTYEPEIETPIYGLTKNVDSHNPMTLTFHEVRAMWSDVTKPGPLHQRLKYIFGAPGWQPEVSPSFRHTSAPNFLPVPGIKQLYLSIKTTGVNWKELKPNYMKRVPGSSFSISNTFNRFFPPKNDDKNLTDHVSLGAGIPTESRLPTDHK